APPSGATPPASKPCGGNWGGHVRTVPRTAEPVHAGRRGAGPGLPAVRRPPRVRPPPPRPDPSGREPGRPPGAAAGTPPALPAPRRARPAAAGPAPRPAAPAALAPGTPALRFARQPRHLVARPGAPEVRTPGPTPARPGRYDHGQWTAPAGLRPAAPVGP